MRLATPTGCSTVRVCPHAKGRVRWGVWAESFDPFIHPFVYSSIRSFNVFHALPSPLPHPPVPDHRLYVETPERDVVIGKKRSKTSGRKQAKQTLREPAQWTLKCETLAQWMAIASEFEASAVEAVEASKSKSKSSKSSSKSSKSSVKSPQNQQEQELHRTLVEQIVPEVTAFLEEKDKQKELEEALLSRKRSNRLVLRQIEEMERQDELDRRRKQQEALAHDRQETAKRRREDQVRCGVV